MSAPSEDSDQPGHLPSLIRVFAVRSMGSLGPTVSSCGQRRLWSDWADAQADLSPRWAHAHFVGFVMSRLIWLTQYDIVEFIYYLKKFSVHEKVYSFFLCCLSGLVCWKFCGQGACEGIFFFKLKFIKGAFICRAFLFLCFCIHFPVDILLTCFVNST